MTTNPFRAAEALACLGALFFLLLADAGAGVAAIDDCAAVGRKVKSAVEKEPTTVLVIVEDALTAHPDCACEIVKGAILGSEADNDLVKEIVITAVTTAETKAAEIAECAVAAAPDAAKAVKAGLEQALGEVVGLDGEEGPFVGAPVNMDEIFLLAPLGPSSGFSSIQIYPSPTSPPNPVP